MGLPSKKEVRGTISHTSFDRPSYVPRRRTDPISSCDTNIVALQKVRRHSLTSPEGHGNQRLRCGQKHARACAHLLPRPQTELSKEPFPTAAFGRRGILDTPHIAFSCNGTAVQEKSAHSNRCDVPRDIGILAVRMKDTNAIRAAVAQPLLRPSKRCLYPYTIKTVI
jgi:hypothetical protein